jgi:hypothetical protein
LLGPSALTWPSLMHPRSRRWLVERFFLEYNGNVASLY